MNEKEIGFRIKQARELRDMTLQDIADRVGIAKSTVQRYEAGSINKIKLPVIHSIANALSVNPAWIVGKDDNMDIASTLTPPLYKLSPAEEDVILKYRTLDEYGQINVNSVLNNEYARCQDSKVISLKEEPSPYSVHTLAAHARADATEEDKQKDYDLMNDPSIWGDKN